jgi:hypothetical protein
MKIVLFKSQKMCLYIHTSYFTPSLHTATAPNWARPASLSMFHRHTQLHTPHSLRLLWTRDQPDAETLYLTTHNTHNRHTFVPPGGIRTRNPSKQTAADPRRSKGGSLGSAQTLNVTRKYSTLRIQSVSIVKTNCLMLFTKIKWRLL